MFTTVSMSGAKLETVIEEIGKLENAEDRYLVVMVGTNNLNSEGSEIVKKRFVELIQKCKEVKKS